ncbi:MAG: GNAT family N-acetyltransferase [Burkholderiales bacterium]|nr:GNAT family N-acetyltransferase [Burkholderiales bacterium]
MYKLNGELSLRAVTEHDQSFLDDLYISRREDLQQLGLASAMLDQLIKMQQQAQSLGIHQHYPNADYWIVAHGNQAVGRVVVDAGSTDFRLVDIAIIPAAQRKGIAREILFAMQERARHQNMGISLAVEKNNNVARSLYLGMGFFVHSDDMLFEQMHWRAASSTMAVEADCQSMRKNNVTA